MKIKLQRENHKRQADLVNHQHGRPPGDSSDRGSVTTIRLTTPTLSLQVSPSTAPGGISLSATTEQETATDHSNTPSKQKRNGISSSQKMTMMMKRRKKKSEEENTPSTFLELKHHKLRN